MVGGNWNDSLTVLPVLFEIVATFPLIVALVKPVNVCPVAAVSVTVAVYLVFAANALAFGDHATALMVKLPVPVAVVFGIAAVAGAVTEIAALVMGVELVGGNWNDSLTELPVLFDIVAAFPLIVALVRPVNERPAAAVSVTVAVYLVFAAKTLTFGDHETVPVVKPPVPVTVAAVFGVAPVTGAVTEISALVIDAAGSDGGNWNDSLTVFPELFDIVAAFPLIVALVRPVNVCPEVAVSVTVAVYLVFAANTLTFGVHETAPVLKPPELVAVAVVFGDAPVTGATTLMAAPVIRRSRAALTSLLKTSYEYVVITAIAPLEPVLSCVLSCVMMASSKPLLPMPPLISECVPDWFPLVKVEYKA